MHTPPTAIAAGPIVPDPSRGLAADAAFFARLGVRCAPVVTRLGAPGAAPVDGAAFRNLLVAARGAVGGAVGVVKAGEIATATQAEALAACAGQLGAPLVADVRVPRHGAPAEAQQVFDTMFAAATLAVVGVGDAQRIAGSVWDGTDASLDALARSLATGPRTIAIVAGKRLAAATAGGAVDIVVVDPVATVPSLGKRHALTAVAAGYVALGLPLLAAAAAAHRFVAAALAATREASGAPTPPAPWSV